MATVSQGWRDSIIGRITSLRTSQAVIANLAGIPENKFSAFINGSRGLENPDLQQLYSLLVDLEKLARIAAPLPIDFKDRIALKAALEALKHDDLRPILKRADVAVAAA